MKHLWKTRKIGISAAKQGLEIEMKSVAKEAKSFKKKPRKQAGVV